ncbi:hypothetical protein JW979_04895 [bacterium]|nr:hypothetical protein [candidate division CSSED10-310 bacterium]
MTDLNDKPKKSFREKLVSFSDEVFRNYMIMRLRWKISALEKRRSAEIIDLGNRTFRLIKRKQLEIPKVENLVRTIDKLETDIETLEERLRDIIIRSDLPKQLTTGEVSVQSSEDIKPESKPSQKIKDKIIQEHQQPVVKSTETPKEPSQAERKEKTPQIDKRSPEKVQTETLKKEKTEQNQRPVSDTAKVKSKEKESKDEPVKQPPERLDKSMNEQSKSKPAKTTKEKNVDLSDLEEAAK